MRRVALGGSVGAIDVSARPRNGLWGAISEGVVVVRTIQIDDQHWDLYEGGGESAEDSLSRITAAMATGGLVTIQVGVNGDAVTYNAARITWVRLNPEQI